MRRSILYALPQMEMLTNEASFALACEPGEEPWMKRGKTALWHMWEREGERAMIPLSMVHLLQQYQRQSFPAGPGSSWLVAEDNGSSLLLSAVLAKKEKRTEMFLMTP